MRKLFILFLPLYILTSCNEMSSETSDSESTSSDSVSSIDSVSMDELLGENNCNLSYQWTDINGNVLTDRLLDTMNLEISYTGDIEGMAEQSEFILTPETIGAGNTCEISRVKKNTYQIVKSDSVKQNVLRSTLSVRSNTFLFETKNYDKRYSPSTDLLIKLQYFED